MIRLSFSYIGYHITQSLALHNNSEFRSSSQGQASIYIEKYFEIDKADQPHMRDSGRVENEDCAKIYVLCNSFPRKHEQDSAPFILAAGEEDQTYNPRQQRGAIKLMLLNSSSVKTHSLLRGSLASTFD
jgi:hypothetical protein